VAQAGGALLTESVRASSLDLALSAALKPWRSSSATHNPAKVLTAIDRARATARTAVRKPPACMPRTTAVTHGPRW